jgi:predicted ferric reductase
MWSLDRALRIIRICATSFRSKGLGVQVKATYNADADVIRLETATYLGDRAALPGQHLYIYHWDGFTAFQSHPFTICSWDACEESGSPTASSPTSSSATEKDAFDKELGLSVAVRGTDSSRKAIKHSFLIRPLAGSTARLRNKLAAAEKGSRKTMSVLLEGPYGSFPDLRHHSDILFVAGGTGITATVSHATYLHQHHPRLTAFNIVWVLRDVALATDVCEHEFSNILLDPRFTLHLYVTGSETTVAAALAARPNVKIHTGRPDVATVLAESRESATRSLGVLSCGPAQLADSCRKEVVSAVGEPGAPIEYYSETMGW